ncbi:hypothetical protein [Delftia tsuruhatensis]|uniref:hypothetical protein n=1 Tax=Delftia tsuruhatensis TaxID=180282 RepID=UPI002090A11C|nr:hypothetical protein [Delftia tsuruhatensis]MCR4547981.1 hypothetical protein [Delftia tsuruhatensis]
MAMKRIISYSIIVAALYAAYLFINESLKPQNHITPNVKTEIFNQQSKSTANEDTQNANQVTVEQQQSSASQTSAFIQDEIDRFRTSLADPLSHDEKLQATNRLHNIIRSTQRREVRESLRQELLSVIDSNRSKYIVKSAIFDYTRSLNSLDNASEAIRVLDLGLKNGILTTAEYAGESIHMGFLFDDKAMIKNGLNTGDEYSNIVLYNYISGITESNGKKIIDHELLVYINSHPIKFSGAPFSFSLTEAIQYNEWAMAKANVESILNGADPVDILSAPFKNPLIDPRELLALSISPDIGLKIMKKVIASKDHQIGLENLDNFMTSYSYIPAIKSASENMERHKTGLEK